MESEIVLCGVAARDGRMRVLGGPEIPHPRRPGDFRLKSLEQALAHCPVIYCAEGNKVPGDTSKYHFTIEKAHWRREIWTVYVFYGKWE